MNKKKIMYYLITTDDLYALDIEKFDTIEKAKKALEKSPWTNEYKAIIKGDMILEENKYKE